MTLRYFHNVCTLICVVCFLSFTSGCASFYKPKYTLKGLVPISLPASITYDVKAMVKGAWSTPGTKSLQEQVDLLFAQSNLFRQSTFVAPTASQGYHLSLLLDKEEIVGLETILTGIILTPLSGGLVPCWFSTKYTLAVNVRKDDELLMHYEYERRRRSWIQIFLVFLMSKYPDEDAPAIEDMLSNLLHDLNEDKVFSEPLTDRN